VKVRIRDSRGTIHTLEYWNLVEGELLLKAEPYEGRIISEEQALAEIAGAGIPLRNASVDRGDPGDYGVPMWNADNRHVAGPSCFDFGGPVWAWRRFVFCETGAGLAEDENGDIESYPEERKKLEDLGWHYVGSGGIRVEVYP